MLRRLRLHQVRCFETVELALDPEEVTVFTGANAVGKTTLLEAICVLQRLQSPRASSLGDLVRFGAEAGAVEGDHGEHLLRVILSRPKRLVVDGDKVGRARDYLAQSGLVVWMGNDDIRLVRGGAERRRRFLDFVASQMTPGYLEALRHYERALRARNHLLKMPAPDTRQLAAYATLLVEHGGVVTAARAALVERLALVAREMQATVGGGGEPLDCLYEDGSPDGLEAALAATAQEERRRRLTVAGPHRDDLRLSLHDRPAAAFASEGQQRTIALALKLAQARVLHGATKHWPILLLDDIFGELDPERRHRLWDALPDGAQTLVTSTSLDWWREDGRARARILRVTDGQVESP